MFSNIVNTFKTSTGKLLHPKLHIGLYFPRMQQLNETRVSMLTWQDCLSTPLPKYCSGLILYQRSCQIQHAILTSMPVCSIDRHIISWVLYSNLVLGSDYWLVNTVTCSIILLSTLSSSRPSRRVQVKPYDTRNPNNKPNHTKAFALSLEHIWYAWYGNILPGN